MLSRSEIAGYLEDCKLDPVAIDEVLGAYVLTKYMRGYDSDRCLAKLRMLIEHLKTYDGGNNILKAGGDAFRVIGHEIAQGGGHIGQSPATTPTGKKVWNLIRRQITYSGSPSTSTNTSPSTSRASSIASTSESSRTKRLLMSTDEIYGGPGSVASFIAPHQKSTVNKHIGSMLGVGLGLEGPINRQRRRGSAEERVSNEQIITQSRERLAARHFTHRPQLVAVLPGYESDTPDYESDHAALPIYEGRRRRNGAGLGDADDDEEGEVEIVEGDREFWGETIRADALPTGVAIAV